MGTIRSVVTSFDNSSELGQTQREAVEALATLANTVADNFKILIEQDLLTAGTEYNRTVPISSVLNKTSQVRAFASTEVVNIGGVVKKALQSFMKGSAQGIIDGIGDLLTDTLAAFLGEASASTGTIEEYYVVTEGLAVVRYDMKAWYLNTTASAIQKKMERVTAVVGVKSIVDLSQLDFYTFLYLYQDQLQLAGVDNATIETALERAKLIYETYQKVQPNDSEEIGAEAPSFRPILIAPAARARERRELKTNPQISQEAPVPDSKRPPYNAVGYLAIQDQNDNWSYGTGALISSDLVLTCSHNLISQINEKEPYTAKQILFYPGYNKTHDVDPPPGLSYPVALGVYSTNYYNGVDGWDVALCRLTGSVPNIGYFFVPTVTGTEIIGKFLTLAGYPEGHNGEMWMDVDQVVSVEISNNVIIYTHDTMPGSSGSPAYNYDTQTDKCLQYAIHVAGPRKGNPKTLRRGVLITQEIQNWLYSAAQIKSSLPTLQLVSLQ